MLSGHACSHCGLYVAKYSIPMTDPYVNGRLMPTKLRGIFVDGQCTDPLIWHTDPDPSWVIGFTSQLQPQVTGQDEE